MDRFTTDEQSGVRIARELKASEERLRAIFNNEPECVKVVDLSGRILDMNAAGLAMLQAASIEQVRGVDVARFIHPDDLPDVKATFEQAVAGERGAVTFRIRTFGGAERWAESHFSPLRAASDAVDAVLSVTHDITERRRAREERDLYAQAMRAMNVGLLILQLDPDTSSPTLRFVAANEAALRLTRRREEELVGQTVADCFPSLAEADVHTQALDVIREGKARLVGDVAFEDDRIPPSVFNVELSPISPLSIAATFQDVTEQRRLAEQLQQSQKMEAVGRLAGGVAQDFNTLLTVIIGYLEASVAHPSAPEDLRHDLEHAHHAADRAARLTRQLLAFSSRQVLQPRVIDVDGMLRDLHPIIERMARDNVNVVLQPHATGACVRVDPGQLQQVIINVAANAYDAMPAGGTLTIRTERSTDDDGAPVARITVSDTGSGMDGETQAQIFEPFFTTKGDGGAGLGLSTVYGIVRQSGGSITCQSVPGEGSNFFISFPLVAGAVEPMAAPTARASKGREWILVVEDQAALRRLMMVTLERAGYRVEGAANGEEALAILRSGKTFDVMVTDLVMPGMNGRQLADALGDVSPATRVVFVSGYFHDPAASAAFLHFLQKPFTPTALLAKVREALDRPV